MRALVLLSILVLAVPVVAVADPGLAFGSPVKVGARIGEPGLRIAEDGTIWVHFPSGFYKSTNGGASFQRAGFSTAVIFGGDADMAILQDGSLLYADLGLPGISVARSTSNDGTGPWLQNMIASDRALTDRQWIEAGKDPLTGGEVVYLAYNAVAGVPFDSGLHIVSSRSGGLVFEGAVTLPASMGWNCFRGNVAISPVDGRAYVADCNGFGPSVWVSSDGGFRWQNWPVDLRSTGYSAFLFPIVTTDAAGNVYVAWNELAGGETNVFLAGSSDGGRSWSKIKLTDATGAGTMAWPVGGSDGRVGIAWYQADVQGHAGSLPSHALWRVKYAIVEDFFGARTVTSALVSSDVIQQGFICGSGTGCSGGRNLLDFFEVRPDNDGMANVVYTDGCDPCNSPSTSRASNVTFAKQMTGPSLFG